jgi:hypothetical protein
MGALEMLIVAAAVLVSIVYSAWRLTSTQIHLRVIDLLERLTGNRSGWLGRLRSKETQQLASGCAACSPNTKISTHGPNRS